MVVYTSVPTMEIATTLASALLHAGIAACIQCSPIAQSYFLWKGALQSSSEIHCAIKTTPTHLDAVSNIIANVHPYEVPEILAVPVTFACTAYTMWVHDCVSKPILPA